MKHSKIILFFPKLESEDANLLPMSLLMVAAPLVVQGYPIKIIDQRVDDNWQETLLTELKNQPLAVGFSVLTGRQILHSLAASKLVKENSQAPVVWGGVHPSLLPEQTLENENIDFIIVGEGENSFLKLIQALESGSAYEGLDGLGYKKGHRIFWRPQIDFIDLDNLPPVPYHLIEVEKYISKVSFASGEKGRNIAFYTSRGCPHRCGFCYNQEFNKRRWRGKSAPKVVAEMQQLIDNYGITALEIEDDEFFVNIERAKEICRLIKEQGIKLDIFATCRVNYLKRMDDDFLKILYEVGFRTLAFGVETGAPRVQDLIHKDINNEQVIEAIERLKRVNINSKYYFMVGFPTETLDEIYQTTDLIQKMKQLDPGIRIPSWRVYTPYPGTDLYALSMRQGFKPPQSLEDWAHYDFKTVKMPWLNRKISRLVNNVSFLIKFLELEDKGVKSWSYRLSRFYSRIVNWRWRHRYFNWLPEKPFINFYFFIKNAL